MRAAETEFERLRSEEFAGREVALLHGRLPGDEKDRIMRAFLAGEIQVLVATTVIEVGIDVAGATVMVIENAERFRAVPAAPAAGPGGAGGPGGALRGDSGCGGGGGRGGRATP